MCLCCCCCNCCNSQTTKCIEMGIFTLTIISFVSSILGLSFIKWEHISKSCIIFWGILGIFSLLELLLICLIICWRTKKTINMSNNSCALCLSRLGLMMTIVGFFLAIISESLTKSYLDEYDHPCRYLKDTYNINNYTIDDSFYFNFRRQLVFTQAEKEELCKKITDPEKYFNNTTYTENLMSYISPSIYQVCCFLLWFFWFNDMRRIRSRVDGPMSTPIDREAGMRGRGFNMGYGGGFDDYSGGIQYDIYGRPMHIDQSIRAQVINVQSSSRRLSGQNMNFARFGYPGGRGGNGNNYRNNNNSINESNASEGSNSVNNASSFDRKSINSDKESDSEINNNPNEIAAVSNRRKSQRQAYNAAPSPASDSSLNNANSNVNVYGNSDVGQNSNKMINIKKINNLNNNKMNLNKGGVDDKKTSVKEPSESSVCDEPSEM